MIISSDRIDDMSARAKALAGSLEKLKTKLAGTVRRDAATGSQRRQRKAALLAEVGDSAAADRQLERLIGGNDLSPINYLAIGAARARAVCRIHLRDAAQRTIGFGTGFLIAPGVLMTNHHVIADAQGVGASLAEFDYEYDIRNKDKPVARFAISASDGPLTDKALDFCIARVAPRSEDGRAIESFGWMPLNPAPGKAIVGEYLTIIQHPAGERKQVCVRENKLLKYDENGSTLWYATDTLAGSSGSPIHNALWQVVGLHHKGVPKTDKQGRWLTTDGTPWDSSMDESRVQWIANEGIRISSIFRFLQAAHPDHPLTRLVVSAAQAGASDLLPTETIDAQPESSISQGELRVTIPVHIRVGLGAIAAGPLADPSAPRPAPTGPQPPAAPPSSDDIEAVHIDQSNYHLRPGYNPNFLGVGKRSLPLPKSPIDDLLVISRDGKKISQLNYWTYSVLMSKSRRLALVSATNVNTKERDRSTKRADDSWFYDTRIPESAQIGPELYAQQREFEMDRTQNPFDRGHLCKRMDCQWGPDPVLGKRNGDDSFHWTNCTPQHYLFNQGSKQWLGLEDYVTDIFASATGLCSVFNGPIFDAPRSVKAADGRLRLNLKGPPEKDPTFGDFKIPKQFFKIVACLTKSGKPAAKAYIMSQEDFLARIPRLKGWKHTPSEADEVLSDAEARKYEVAVSDIERLTRLDFGQLRDW